MRGAVNFDVVIPTTGRASLARLIQSLGSADGRQPDRVILVDDRPGNYERLPGSEHFPNLEVVSSGGRGPAAARNEGWRRSKAEWIVFLDDDVVVTHNWLEALARDLESLPPFVAGSQGNVMVPVPSDRLPTDWERNVKGLETAVWATADMACRRSALEQVGGFDERFRRAYREDADLGLRLARAGYGIVRGTRVVSHPPGQAGFWTSVRLQAGNADDVLMRAIHGRGWREAAGAPRGRIVGHVATTVPGVLAVAALAARRRRAALVTGALWVAATAEFAWARISPGPKSFNEVTKMIATSAVLPAFATAHLLSGVFRHHLRHRVARRPKPAGVLIDRDGTLVRDVPYNGDPERVVPMEGAREALDRLRRAGIPTAVVSNQSGVARGFISPDQVEAVNRRIEALLGPLGPWIICHHGPEDGCGCRKPSPGLVIEAAQALNLRAEDCVVIGDIGADMEAARAAGARGILVPTPITRKEEIDAAPEVAPNLNAAVDLLLGGPG
ncbi:MAG: HAD-IIIA family hydrolase [Actinomycetota bacterium]|nr:HAD-IIIA family hydrolase [Actinomycetota bacterium]